MEVSRKKFDLAVAKKIISQQQADELLAFLNAQPSSGPGFDFTNVLYYMGGLVAIGAMTLFMNLGWEKFGGWGILCISLAYAGVGLLLTNKFQKNGHAVPAGICA